MIVDSSALISVLLKEPGWERVARALTSEDSVAIGAPTLTETAIVLLAKGVGATVLPALLHRLGITIEPFTHAHALLAADAYAAFGRGNHAASLNYGDCMTYATARLARARLLFVGDDFGKTDIEAVLDA